MTTATLVSIAVTPNNPNAPRGTNQQFTATGADGELLDGHQSPSFRPKARTRRCSALVPLFAALVGLWQTTAFAAADVAGRYAGRDYSGDSLARFVLDVADHLKLERFVIGGNSLGRVKRVRSSALANRISSSAAGCSAGLALIISA